MLILKFFVICIICTGCVGRRSYDYYSQKAYAALGVKGNNTTQPENVKLYYEGDPRAEQRISQNFSQPNDAMFSAGGRSPLEMGMKGGMGAMPQVEFAPSQEEKGLQYTSQMVPQNVEAETRNLPYAMNNTQNYAQETYSRAVEEKHISNDYYGVYLQSLGTAYGDYASFMSKAGYVPDGQLLQSKADTAFAGNDVMFETEYSFDLPLDKRPMIAKNRKVLENIKAKIEALKQDPQTVAQVQASYDCTVLEAKNRAYSHQTNCATAFFRGVEYLEKRYGMSGQGVQIVGNIGVERNLAGSFTHEQSSKNGFESNEEESHFLQGIEEFEDRAVLKYNNHKSFVVYYNVGDANLNSTAIYSVNQAIAFTEDYEGYKIKVLGFADRIGDRDFNKKLSKKRAETVKKALIERGISPSNIETVIFGEDYNSVNTRDGVGESFNRRVVIEVNVTGTFDEEAFILQQSNINNVIY